MTNELDDLFNSFEEQNKNNERAKREENHNRASFAKDFRYLLKSVVHPAIMPILDSLKRRNCRTLVLSKRKSGSFPLTHIAGFDQPPAQDAKGQLLYNNYENYYIGGGQIAKGYGIVMTVLGNVALQKVCVFTEYLRFASAQETTSLKRTEQQFELEETVPDLFEPMVTVAFKELVALKQADDEATQLPSA